MKKKTYINPETGEKVVIDHSKPYSGCTMTVEDARFLMNLQIKNNQKKFSEFTEEEQKLYSEIMDKIEKENDNV